MSYKINLTRSSNKRIRNLCDIIAHSPFVLNDRAKRKGIELSEVLSIVFYDTELKSRKGR